MKTLLAIAQEFCRRQGLPIPQSVINSQDDSTQQIWGLLNEGQMDLVDRGDWQQLTLTTAPFAHGGYTYPGGGQYIAAYISETGTASTFASEGGIGGTLPYGSGYIIVPGFKKIIPETFFCTSTRLPLYGPMTASEWAYMTALGAQPAQFAWRQEGDTLIIYPFDGGVLFQFKYISRFTIYNAANFATTVPTPVYDIFTSDTDASLLPDKIVLQDLKWRWKAQKGLPYAEDQRILEQLVTNALGSNVPAPVVSMDQGYDTRVVGPGLLIAAGNWPL